MAEAFMRCYHVTGKAKKKVNKVNNEKKNILNLQCAQNVDAENL